MDNIILVSLIALFFLTAMEIVLGIDNIVFIAIITGRLPKPQQAPARRLGLALALVMRIALLLALKRILLLTNPLFELSHFGVFTQWLAENEEVNHVSLRDIILLGGGLFLVAKSVFEIHAQLEDHGARKKSGREAGFTSVLIQIAVLDIVFSLDSVITAVGMAKELWVMITAIVIAVGVMLIFAETISTFVRRHPTLKMLALSFLILIGVLLIAEGVGAHLDKGYIYFAMAFALIVEALNIRVRGKAPAIVPEAH